MSKSNAERLIGPGRPAELAAEAGRPPDDPPAGRGRAASMARGESAFAVTSALLLAAHAAVDANAALAATITTALQNPMPLYNTTGQPMNVHDGDVRQWTPGGPFYYYGMRHDRPDLALTLLRRFERISDRVDCKISLHSHRNRVQLYSSVQYNKEKIFHYFMHMRAKTICGV